MSLRTTVSIYKNDLRMTLSSWHYYVVLTGFMVFSAFVFLERVFNFQSMSEQLHQINAPHLLERLNVTDMILSPLFAQAAVLLVFIVPILTMGSISRERASGTLELLMTIPVDAASVLGGKFLALMSVLVSMLLGLIVYPIALLFISRSTTGEAALEWNTVLCAYAGLFLFAMACVSLSLFWSSMSNSQVIAATGAFLCLIFLWVLGWRTYGLSGPVAEVASYMSIITHIESFVRGVIKLSDIVYYLSLSFLGLVLAHRFIKGFQ